MALAALLGLAGIVTGIEMARQYPRLRRAPVIASPKRRS